MKRIRRILHPSDFSGASAAAFAKAVDMAKTNRAELVVLHVLSPFVPFGGSVSNLAYQEIEARSRAQTQKELNILVAKARRAGAPSGRTSWCWALMVEARSPCSSSAAWPAAWCRGLAVRC